MEKKVFTVYMYILQLIWIYSWSFIIAFIPICEMIYPKVTNHSSIDWSEYSSLAVISVKRCVLFVAFFQWTIEAPLATARTTSSRYLATWAARMYKMFMWELTNNTHVKYVTQVYNNTEVFKCSLHYLILFKLWIFLSHFCKTLLPLIHNHTIRCF